MLKELVAQSGNQFLAKIFSRRYRLLDGPITQMFANDYEIKKKFKQFPDVNTVIFDEKFDVERENFRSSNKQKCTS